MYDDQAIEPRYGFDSRRRASVSSGSRQVADKQSGSASIVIFSLPLLPVRLSSPTVRYLACIGTIPCKCFPLRAVSMVTP